jgi:HEPN domain-containing protein
MTTEDDGDANLADDQAADTDSVMDRLVAKSGRLFVTPHGTMLRAREFIDAAEFLRLRTDRFSPVSGFLACRAIELSLKAFLLARDETERSLRSLRHNLERILTKVDARGLHRFIVLSASDRKLLVSVSKDYAGQKWAYYDIQWSLVDGIAPDPKALADLAERIVSSLERICLDLTQGRGGPLQLSRE